MSGSAFGPHRRPFEPDPPIRRSTWVAPMAAGFVLFAGIAGLLAMVAAGVTTLVETPALGLGWLAAGLGTHLLAALVVGATHQFFGRTSRAG